VDVELGLKFGLPLVAQMGRADDAQPKRISSVEEFPSDQGGLNRFSDPNIVGYKHPHGLQPERHD
jgi:hypothetical protein